MALKKGILMLLAILAIASIPAAFSIDLYMFYGQGCPHCAKMEEFLGTVKADYPELNIFAYETYFNAENLRLFEDFSKAYNTSIDGVPTIYIDNTVFTGYSPEIAGKLGAKISSCAKEKCVTLTPSSASSGNYTNTGNIIIVSGNLSSKSSKGMIIFAVMIAVITILIVSMAILNRLKSGKSKKEARGKDD